MTFNVQLMSISMPVMRESYNNSIVNLSIELSSKVMFLRDVCLSDCHNSLSAGTNESVALSPNMKQDAREDIEVIIIFPFYVWLGWVPFGIDWLQEKYVKIFVCYLLKGVLGGFKYVELGFVGIPIHILANIDRQPDSQPQEYPLTYLENGCIEGAVLHAHVSVKRDETPVISVLALLSYLPILCMAWLSNVW
jgi:hypothetical protein